MSNINNQKSLRLFSSTASRGFTLVEITLVVGILVVLSAIVLVALNIRGNRANAHNVQRKMDMETIQKALDLRAQDTGDALPSGLAVAGGLSERCIGTDSGCYNLTTDLTPLYLGVIPKDPKTGTDADTGYVVSENSGGAITIQAISPEAIDNQTPEIKASR